MEPWLKQPVKHMHRSVSNLSWNRDSTPCRIFPNLVRPRLFHAPKLKGEIEEYGVFTCNLYEVYWIIIERINSYRRMKLLWKSSIAKYSCAHVFGQFLYKEPYLEQKICILPSSQ
jgi:hypothetical protein